jgi:hypothetical protein
METAQRSRSIAIAREIAEEAIDAWRHHLFLGTTMSAMRATAKVEQLLHYLVSTFPSDATRGDARKIIDEPGRRLAEANLDVLPPSAVPLVIMRELLVTHEVKFETRGAPSWRTFLERYGAGMTSLGVAWRKNPNQLS